METTAVKFCNDCQTSKPVSSFAKNSKRADKLQSECRVCQAARRAAWKKNNPDKVAAQRQKRRAMLAAVGGTLTGRDISLLRGLMPCCCKCGSDEFLALDHIVPISKGGKNDIFNIQILCRSCNSAKCNYNSDDYRLIPVFQLVCNSSDRHLSIN